LVELVQELDLFQPPRRPKCEASSFQERLGRFIRRRDLQVCCFSIRSWNGTRERTLLMAATL